MTVREQLGRSGGAFAAIGLFSALLNALGLAGSIYMLQIYDRVLPSHSVPTLIGLTTILLGLYLAFSILDIVRTRMMSRIGARLERDLRERVFAIVLAMPLRTRGGGDGMQPVRDLDQIRGFLASAGPVALFDLPWLPIYMGLAYLLHPWLGLLGTAGALLLIVFTLMTEARSRVPIREAASAISARNSLGEAARRNAEAVQALGMGTRMARLWEDASERLLEHQMRAGDVATTWGSLSKVLRMVLQSLVLGLGAWLSLQGQASAGTIIAASIIVARALAPIEIVIANWRGFLAARQSSAQLKALLAAMPARADTMKLPAPMRSLGVENLWVGAPGQQRMLIQNIGFNLNAGAGLGIVGPSASGKSTLARALVGAWLPLRGNIRLDGAALGQWSASELGQHIGYLPQDIELFDASVAANIARLEADPPSDAVIAAATAAGVHEMILRFPEGYETRIGEGGAVLSAGQRQRIALARALYGDPFLIVLDEPNSNLDAEGDAALTRAIVSVRQRGGVVIVIAHRVTVLSGLDLLLVMQDGQAKAFGPKEEVLRALATPAAAATEGTPPTTGQTGAPQSRLKVVEGNQ